jgi:hypothetical protein
MLNNEKPKISKFPVLCNKKAIPQSGILFNNMEAPITIGVFLLNFNGKKPPERKAEKP